MIDDKGFEIDAGWWLLGYDGKDKTAKIPNGVKEISFRAFYGSKIERVEIPDSVDFIDVQAFLCCSELKYIVIPLSVKGVEYAIVEDCDSLTDIFLEAPNVPDTWDAADWLNGCKARVHCAGEWKYVNGEPVVTDKS